MRVIAGSARRLLLKTPAGLETRPTTDRIKETLFNILQSELYGSRFLDLFAGSGAIGIEALSRGAKAAVFVDNQSAAVACIKDNLAAVRFEKQARILAKDCVSAIAELAAAGECFDIIFMDPPYRAGVEKAVLCALHDTSLVHEGTVIIIEAALDNDLSDVEACGFCIKRIKKYKTNKHFFLAPMIESAGTEGHGLENS